MKQFFRFLTVGVFNTLLGYCVIFTYLYVANMSNWLQVYEVDKVE
jgi:putative flippase GtrA